LHVVNVTSDAKDGKRGNSELDNENLKILIYGPGTSSVMFLTTIPLLGRLLSATQPHLYQILGLSLPSSVELQTFGLCMHILWYLANRGNYGAEVP
jgi:hypothetical protein